MSSYQFDSIVNRQEAEALKEMIFKRARERAESMTKEAQESYTTSVKNDVMELARDTFVASKNPFSINTEIKTETTDVETESKPKDAGIGFAERRAVEMKSQINYRNKATLEEIANSAIAETMADAHSEFNNRKSFMGALNFLNSQASITLVNKHGNSFEALA